MTFLPCETDGMLYEIALLEQKVLEKALTYKAQCVYYGRMTFLPCETDGMLYEIGLLEQKVLEEALPYKSQFSLLRSNKVRIVNDVNYKLVP